MEYPVQYIYYTTYLLSTYMYYLLILLLYTVSVDHMTDECLINFISTLTAVTTELTCSF